jgi:hypothetical protein
LVPSLDPDACRVTIDFDGADGAVGAADADVSSAAITACRTAGGLFSARSMEFKFRCSRAMAHRSCQSIIRSLCTFTSMPLPLCAFDGALDDRMGAVRGTVKGTFSLLEILATAVGTIVVGCGGAGVPPAGSPQVAKDSEKPLPAQAMGPCPDNCTCMA